MLCGFSVGVIEVPDRGGCDVSLSMKNNDLFRFCELEVFGFMWGSNNSSRCLYWNLTVSEFNMRY